MLNSSILYIGNNLYKENENKTKNMDYKALTKDSTSTFPYDTTSIPYITLDKSTRQYFIDMLVTTAEEAKTLPFPNPSFDKHMLTHIAHSLNANVLIFDFTRISQYQSPYQDPLLPIFLNNMKIQSNTPEESSDELSLYCLIFYSPTMSHFISIIRDTSLNKWFLHTNSLSSNMPNIIGSKDNPYTLLEEICATNHLTQDFFLTSCTYISRFTEQKMNGII